MKMVRLVPPTASVINLTNISYLVDNFIMYEFETHLYRIKSTGKISSWKAV